MTALVAKADISGTPSRATANAGFGSLHDFLNERFSGGTATEAEKAATRTALGIARREHSLTATVNGTGGAPSNGMLITLNPTNIDFRSATLGSGAIVTRSVPAAITLTITSGSTLGGVSGRPQKWAVLGIDNAGTVELSAINLAGGVTLDERGLISTTAEGGAGAADSAAVAYSTTSRSSLAYKVLAVIEHTQATAGTYVTAPSRVYPVESAKSLAPFFRKWAIVTGSRSASTDYYNDTDYDREVSITSNAGGSLQFSLLVDGASRSTDAYSGASGIVCVSATVPPGSYYSLVIAAGTVNVWSEASAA